MASLRQGPEPKRLGDENGRACAAPGRPTRRFVRQRRRPRGRAVVPTRIRLLEEVAGIRVNFCRRPTCPNFGQTPLVIFRGRGAKNAYTMDGPYNPAVLAKLMARPSRGKGDLLRNEVGSVPSRSTAIGR